MCKMCDNRDKMEHLSEELDNRIGFIEKLLKWGHADEVKQHEDRCREILDEIFHTFKMKQSMIDQIKMAEETGGDIEEIIGRHSKQRMN